MARCYHLPMIAAVLRGPRSLAVTTVLSPTPGPNDAVIRVTAAGLCGTDYRIWTGERPVRYPLVMGHEFVGTVAGGGSAGRQNPGGPGGGGGAPFSRGRRARSPGGA